MNKPDYRFSGEWPTIDLRIPISNERGEAVHVLRAIPPDDVRRLYAELHELIPSASNPVTQQTHL